MHRGMILMIRETINVEGLQPTEQNSMQSIYFTSELLHGIKLSYSKLFSRDFGAVKLA